MTSILSAHSIPFPSTNLMAQIQDSTLERRPKMEPDDKNRGRRRSRVNSKDKNGSGGETPPVEGDVADGHSSGSDGGPSRKRRRSRKGLDKKFECPQEGCGKSYSRAEHLYADQCATVVALLLTYLVATATNSITPRSKSTAATFQTVSEHL
jgi:hypothetical protein